MRGEKAPAKSNRGALLDEEERLKLTDREKRRKLGADPMATLVKAPSEGEELARLEDGGRGAGAGAGGERTVGRLQLEADPRETKRGDGSDDRDERGERDERRRAYRSSKASVSCDRY